MLLKLFRNAAGYIIVFLSWLTKPKPIERSAEHQLTLQDSLKGLSLYQLYACPFCVKTRRALHAMNVQLDIKDIGKDRSMRQELEQGGGRVKVPCLRISEDGADQWMYESNDIIAYLEQRVQTIAS